jgi:hypothetical protein
VVPYFCAKPSCIHAYCPLHGKSFIRLSLTCWLTAIVYQ